MTTLFDRPLLFLLSAISIVITITIHEFAHALTADRLGDPTPGLQKRLTLNPLAHLDLLGTAMIFIVGFGWGKPVQYDPYNLKDPKRDGLIIALAGPMSNFILALVLSILIKLLTIVVPVDINSIGLFSFLPQLMLQLIVFNIAIGVFNLIPIYPLDGFRVVGGLLPHEKSREWEGLSRYGIIFLLLLLIPIGQTSMLETVMRPILMFLYGLLLPG